MTRRVLSGMRPSAIALGLMSAISGCSAAEVRSTGPADTATSAVSPYPSIAAGLGEHLYADEPAIAQRVGDANENAVRKDYRAGHARRDAHPKAHGCVKAELHIMDALPDRLAKGMFAPGKSYDAWIRFSNGSKDATRADSKGDARGLAIMVLGVPGKKLLDDVDQATTQDFILISHPVFFANDPGRYLSLIENESSESSSKKLLIPFALGLKGSVIAWRMTSKKISNPLQTRYWSTVPYQLGSETGGQVVKYSARSCSATTDPMPDKPGPDFLRDALRATLQHGDACMELLVQPRTSNSMDVEDSMTEWKEADAPFFKVASIHIPRQSFDSAEQNAFCENISFNPWHALPEHRPLGVTNRMRKAIYDRISRVRHEMNSVERQEPQ